MKSEKNKMSYRALARVLHRSPSHICRVMNGERTSASLLAAIKRAQGKKGGRQVRCV